MANNADTVLSTPSDEARRIRPSTFHSRLRSLDETKVERWSPDEIIENMDELGDLESLIKKSGIVSDLQPEGALLCPHTFTGVALIDLFMKEKSINDVQALVLAQRLIDGGKMCCVEPKTNRRVHLPFDHHGGIYRLESDRSLGADPVRAYSLTKIYFAKLNSHASNLHILGLHKSTLAFVVLSREDDALIFFRSQEDNKPYDELNIKQCCFVAIDTLLPSNSGSGVNSNLSPAKVRQRSLSNEKNSNNPPNATSNKNEPSTPTSPLISAPSSPAVAKQGAYFALVTPGRTVLFCASSIVLREKWLFELSKLRCIELTPSAAAAASHLGPLGSASPSSSHGRRGMTMDMIMKLQCDQGRFSSPPRSLRKLSIQDASGTLLPLAIATTTTTVASATESNGNNSGNNSSGKSLLNPSLAAASSRLAQLSVDGASAFVAAAKSPKSPPITTSPSPIPPITSHSPSTPSPLAVATSGSGRNTSTSVEVGPTPSASLNPPKETSRHSRGRSVTAEDELTIKSESASTKKQRLAEEALRRLSMLQPHLGFSFDAEGENDNPWLGLLVDQVEEGSPASVAGLKSGDVVIEVNTVRTLTVSDLLKAIKGVLPGSELEVVIERNEQEMVLVAILGAKGMSAADVAALYGIVQQSVEESTDIRSALSLSDVLDVPKYRRTLTRYMESQLCSESIHFLTAVQAYQRISDMNLERREYAARLIHGQFVVENADALVNIDADTRKLIGYRIQKKEFSATLFLDAAKVVYKMCENDVFRRFVSTAEYKSMLEEDANASSDSTSNTDNNNNPVSPSNSSNSSSNPNHNSLRRRLNEFSFSVVALEEKFGELESMAADFSATNNVADRWYHLKKYKSCCKGSALVTWLVDGGYAKQRSGAASVAQRLVDAFVLRHVSEEGVDFEDSDSRLYTFINPIERPALGDLRKKTKAVDGAMLEGTLLLQASVGVHYNRIHVLLHREKRKLFLFRKQEDSELPLLKLKLKGATFKIITEADRDKKLNIKQQDSKEKKNPPPLNKSLTAAIPSKHGGRTLSSGGDTFVESSVLNPLAAPGPPVGVGSTGSSTKSGRRSSLSKDDADPPSVSTGSSNNSLPSQTSAQISMRQRRKASQDDNSLLTKFASAARNAKGMGSGTASQISLVKEMVSYFVFDIPSYPRELVFRIEGFGNSARWTEDLKNAGCIQINGSIKD